MTEIVPMRARHIDQVHAIELRTFPIPWSKQEFFLELKRDHTYYIVAVRQNIGHNETVLGYAGLWHIVNEGQITNVAVDEPHRGLGIGAMLMAGLVAYGREHGLIGLTLEVRVGNRAAQYLYHKFGFTVEGYRKNYYQDTKEDAIIMWKYF